MLLFLFGGVFLLGIWFAYKGKFLEGVFGGIYKILFSAESYLAQRTKDFFISYFYLVDLKKENQLLREEVMTLRQKLAEALDMQKTCQEYQKFLYSSSQIKFPKLPARIIYKGIDPFSELILIDRGTRDGVQPQMPVLALLGEEAVGLVGQVVEVYPNFSKVMLITDPSFAVDVKVVRTGDRAILRGNGDPHLFLEYLPLYSQAIPKDYVVTSGQDALFPPNILIGEVVSLAKDPQGMFKRGEVRPFVDLYNLSWVAVLLSIPEVPL